MYICSIYAIVALLRTNLIHFTRSVLSLCKGSSVVKNRHDDSWNNNLQTYFIFSIGVQNVNHLKYLMKFPVIIILYLEMYTKFALLMQLTAALRSKLWDAWRNSHFETQYVEAATPNLCTGLATMYWEASLASPPLRIEEEGSGELRILHGRSDNKFSERTWIYTT